MLPAGIAPALLTRMSTSFAFSATAFCCALWLRSPGIVSTRTPCASRIPFATASSLSALGDGSPDALGCAGHERRFSCEVQFQGQGFLLMLAARRHGLTM